MARKISAPSESIVIAQKQGKKDGKNEIPRQEWGIDSVPYLTQLRHQYEVKARKIELGAEQKKLSRESRKVQIIRAAIQDRTEDEAFLARLTRAEKELAVAESKLNGGTEEVPMAKFARMRMVTNAFYLPFLFVLFIGEFKITAPAFRILLGEQKGTALLITFSVCVLSIGVAHILGISLKSQFDRSRPKSRLFNTIFSVVAAATLITILFLAYIRGTNGALTAGNMSGVSPSARPYLLWAFYSILQITFILVGTAISFMHHSEIESAVLRAKRKVWLLRRNQNRREKERAETGSSVEETTIDTSKVASRESEVVESQKVLLRAQYEEVAAAYRAANINARRDEMSGAHPALQASELDLRTTQNSFKSHNLIDIQNITFDVPNMSVSA
jgi:hypothetical protein